MATVTQSAKTDRRYGVVEAIVVDLNDPAKEGRVKVQYPWFDENMVSDWCRVSQFYAGPNSGAFFVPELDSEVLVSFIQGNMRQGVVMGCLYNGVDKPATHRDQDRDEKQLITRSGHRITLVDTEGEERIEIVDKSTSHSIIISTKDKGITITAKDGTLTLAAKEIEIKADNALNIGATTIDAIASGAMKLEGKPIDLN